MRSGLVNLPGQHGAFDAFGSDTRKEALRPRKTYQIIASSYTSVDTALDDMLKILAYREGVLKTEMRDATYRITWAKMISVGFQFRATENEITFVHLPVAVDFHCPCPFWEAFADVWYLDGGEDLDDGLSFDGNYTQRTVTSSPDTFTISNSGTAEIRRGLIQIEGTCTNPKIANAANDYWWQWTGSLGSDDKLIVDLGAMSAHLYAPSKTDAWDNITLGDEQIELMKLEIGDNDITFTATSPNCTLTWWWAKTYH